MFRLTKYRGSSWFTAYFPYASGIKIELIRDFVSMETNRGLQ